ncbi:MFS transporter [Falsiroseomonas sp. E2-1-a20]|uniref:MFS transporter n=1 Tax=Falsiroseomonas sp. E2-1-a20 TaxID=3239300 RepID=UPI003F3E397C
MTLSTRKPPEPTDATTPEAIPGPHPAAGRMNPHIAVLALAGFALGTEAFVFVGHLDAMAATLGVPVAAVGQLATAFAFSSALTGPFVAAAVAGVERRRVLVLGLLLIGALNLVAAMLSTLGTLMLVRVLCGLATGLVGPIATVAAAELSPPEARGRAMATVFAGVTLAFVVGVPLGSLAGEVLGWRGTFLWAGLVALVAAAIVRLRLPRIRPGPRVAFRPRAVLGAPAVAPALALTLVGFMATFCVTAYLGPLLGALVGFSGAGVGAMQALIGLGAIAGVVAGGRWADRSSAWGPLLASFLLSAAMLSLFGVLLLLPLPQGVTLALLVPATTLGAAALFLRAPVVQLRLVAAVPAHRPVLLALNGSMVFAGQGLGAALGGLGLSIFGLPALGLLGAAVALAGALLVAATAQHWRTPAR